MLLFNDTAATEIYTLSLHDALPILLLAELLDDVRARRGLVPENAPRGPVHERVDHVVREAVRVGRHRLRSEEHTSELQSRQYLVCRLLLEKKTLRVHVTSVNETPST